MSARLPYSMASRRRPQAGRLGFWWQTSISPRASKSRRKKRLTGSPMKWRRISKGTAVGADCCASDSGGRVAAKAPIDAMIEMSERETILVCIRVQPLRIEYRAEAKSAGVELSRACLLGTGGFGRKTK